MIIQKNGKASESFNLLMVLYMKVKLKTNNTMDVVEWLIQTGTSIRANGKMEKLMALGFSSIPTDLCMRVNGKMISSMATEQNLGILIKSNTLENFQKERKLVTEDLNSKADITRANLRTESLMEREPITFQTVGKYTRVTLKTTIWMVMVLWYGLMNPDMRVNSNKVRLKEKVRKNTLMEIGT